MDGSAELASLRGGLGLTGSPWTRSKPVTKRAWLPKWSGSLAVQGFAPLSPKDFAGLLEFRQVSRAAVEMVWHVGLGTFKPPYPWRCGEWEVSKPDCLCVLPRMACTPTPRPSAANLAQACPAIPEPRVLAARVTRARCCDGRQIHARLRVAAFHHGAEAEVIVTLQTARWIANNPARVTRQACELLSRKRLETRESALRVVAHRPTEYCCNPCSGSGFR